MNEHYAKQHRYFPGSAGIQQAAEAITGQSFATFFADYVAGVKAIPYDEFFQLVGLRLLQKQVQSASAGFATTGNLGAQPEVTSVDANSDAQRAGIAVGDRITHINGRPADANLDDEIEQMQPGTTVRLQVENRRGKRQVELKLAERSEESYELHNLDSVTPAQHAHRTAWIHGDDESGNAP
jgi:predicted metalloprotease with PDZ domain